MAETLFIVNPHSGGGLGRETWLKIKPKLEQEAHNYTVALTRYPQDVPECIAQAAVSGDLQRVVSIGGDGTANVLVNAIMRYNEAHPENALTYGNIPAGTGRDGARGMGIPLATDEAIHYVLHDATPRPLDIGRVQFGDTSHYFLNVSSVGISYEVNVRAEKYKRQPFAFFRALIEAVLEYEAPRMHIEIDGEFWYEGDVYITSVANGSYFGSGMHIAPQAEFDDGLFDVVVVDKMSLLSIIPKLPSIYTGKHLHYNEVHCRRAQHVRIISQTGQPIAMDYDGEPAAGDTVITYEIVPHGLSVLS
jgi:YegS/Rv2252/BmrU family lipid kinase